MTAKNTVVIIVPAVGSMIWKKVLNGPQPSIAAASSSSCGMLRKNWRNRKINRPFLYPMAVADMINSGYGVSIRLINPRKLRNFRYSGTKMVCGGITNIRMTMPKIRALPRNLNRGKTIAAKQRYRRLQNPNTKREDKRIAQRFPVTDLFDGSLDGE